MFFQVLLVGLCLVREHFPESYKIHILHFSHTYSNVLLRNRKLRWCCFPTHPTCYGMVARRVRVPKFNQTTKREGVQKQCSRCMSLRRLLSRHLSQHLSQCIDPRLIDQEHASIQTRKILKYWNRQSSERSTNKSEYVINLKKTNLSINNNVSSTWIRQSDQLEYQSFDESNATRSKHTVIKHTIET